MNSNLLQERSAFTLLELLVVVLFMTLMVSMMIPALARTGPNPKDLQCLNNHRQIAAAVSMYTQDNHDLYPPNPDDGNIQLGHVWCPGNVETSRTADPNAGGPDEFDPDLMKDPQRTIIAPYIANNPAIFVCPTDLR